MPTKYYVLKLLEQEAPSGLMRFFDDADRSPEYFKKGVGWVPDDTLWARIASAEIDDRDIISDIEAAKIVAQWGGRL